MMKKYLFLLIALLALLLSACSEKSPEAPVEEAPAAPTEAQAPEEAPAGILSSFSATDLSGAPVDESILQDYPLTMVNVWATFCGPCINEMPDLGELAAEYQDKGIRIVGMVSDVMNADGSLSESQLSTAQEIVTQTGADYPHILPSEDLYYLLSQISSVPTTFFVDQNGNQVGSAYVGSNSKEAWSAIMDEMLQELPQ